jgi:hypothetical protein
MKTLTYYLLCILALAFSAKSFTQANTGLSNLAKTSVNRNLDPKSTNAINLGASDSSWKNLFLTGSIYLDKKRFVYNPGTENNFVGTQSGNSITTGVSNTGFGFNSLFSDTTGDYNTAVGVYTLRRNTSGSFNAASGSFALTNNTSGSYNSASGYGTLVNNTAGDYNTASGFEALADNTTSYYNTAQGAFALTNNTSGYHNTATGVSALYANTSGTDNTATGLNALQGNTTGDYNTATGIGALYGNNGSYNTADGESALPNTSASEFNTAVGFNAGYTYDNGWNNVFVGANTDVNGTGYFNVIAIGQGTICTASSQVTIGNVSTDSYRAYSNWSNISDGRVKKNIKQNVPGLAFINKLQPVTYNLDPEAIDKIVQYVRKDSTGKAVPYNKAEQTARLAKEKIVYTGFVAQDVEKAAKSLNYNFSGVDAAKNDKDLYGLRYGDFVVPLVKAVQELSKMNDEKDASIDSLKNENANLEQRLARLETLMNVQSTSVGSALLEQNIPNPFSNTTTINYSLPQSYSSAKIIVADSKGIVLKQSSLAGKGKGSVNLDASTLAAGAYQYALYVDGRMIDSKQMVLTK